MVYSLIIKDNIVINRAVGATLITDYPFPYDLILEDVNKNVCMGAIYDPVNGTFSEVGIPQDQDEFSEE